MFYRMGTARTRQAVPLEGTFAGPRPTACWLIGGGPSLAKLPIDLMAACPIPRMCINLAGSGLLRPTFWTSYDPSARFHRSVYLDAGVMKFVHRRRGMDLVPETTFKVCDCPNTYFFETETERGFADFLSREHAGIVDWADSMVQAIDILYRLGFRRIYAAGCEMRVRPTCGQVALARQAGVRYEAGRSLGDFVKACARQGVTAEMLEGEGERFQQYHFEERKPLAAAVNTDAHYFRIAQSLRLCRRSMSLAGLKLISVTPHSRLNDYFDYRRVRDVVADVRREVGDPAAESTWGLYRQTGIRSGRVRGTMQDVLPYRRGKQEQKCAEPEVEEVVLAEEVERLRGKDVVVEEEF